MLATGDTLEEVRESLEEGISLHLAELGQPAVAVELDELEPKSVVANAHLVYA